MIDPGLTGAEENCQVLSRIVSVFSKTVKNRLMSTGLNVTLKHLWPHSETELTKVRDSVTVESHDIVRDREHDSHMSVSGAE